MIPRISAHHVPRRHARIRVLLGAVLLGGLSVTLGLSVPASAVTPVGDDAACAAPGHEARAVTFGTPVWRQCFSGTIEQSSPTVATYDGVTVVAVGDEKGFVHLIDAATGNEMPGWPRQLASGGQPVAIESSPTIAFLNGPRKAPSIIVGSGSTWVTNRIAEVEAFNWNGSTRFVFNHFAHQPGTAVGVVGSPAVGPLRAGSQQDIVFGSWDHYIYALSPTGKLLPGFPFNNGDTIWSSPALYKLPGHAGDTIFLGTDASGLLYHQGHSGLLQCKSGGFVGAWQYSGHGVTPVWRHCMTQSIWSSPSIGVVGHTPVVFVGTSYSEQPFPAATNHLYVFNAINGASLPGWPVKTSGPVLGTPAIGEIGPGKMAVVDTSFRCTSNTLASCSSLNQESISAYSLSGHTFWTTTLRGTDTWSSPVLTPLRGEQWNDVLIGTSYGLYPLTGDDGRYLFGTDYGNQFATLNSGCRVNQSVAVGALPSPGAAVDAGPTNTTPASGESWFVFEACGGPPTAHQPGEIATYRFPHAPAVAPAWPMFHQNFTHTGVEAT